VGWLATEATVGGVGGVWQPAAGARPMIAATPRAAFDRK
jgi:hypothetical protein